MGFYVLVFYWGHKSNQTTCRPHFWTFIRNYFSIFGHQTNISYHTCKASISHKHFSDFTRTPPMYNLFSVNISAKETNTFLNISSALSLNDYGLPNRKIVKCVYLPFFFLKTVLKVLLLALVSSPPYLAMWFLFIGNLKVFLVKKTAVLHLLSTLCTAQILICSFLTVMYNYHHYCVFSP